MDIHHLYSGSWTCLLALSIIHLIAHVTNAATKLTKKFDANFVLRHFQEIINMIMYVADIMQVHHLYRGKDLTVSRERHSLDISVTHAATTLTKNFL